MADARVIAIVGAESTGKTELARALADALSAQGHRSTWVPEALREWCDAHGRTPQQHEQADIARLQAGRIDAAAAAHDWVVADTTALMTAVYSDIVFGDRSLDAEALRLHRRCTLTLLTAIDLPWVADGHQRDGPQVREPVDARLRALLAAGGIGWSVVHGRGPLRLRAAWAACAPLGLSAAPATGLFTRLQQTPAETGTWRCAECDDPDCERHLARRRPV
ncbi:MAG: ATP-binding protein [Rubrivivax sp.]